IDISNLMTLSQIVFQKRKKLGLSRKELAKRCGISKSIIKNLEENEKWPNSQKVFEIFSQLRLPLCLDLKPERDTLPLNLECFLKRKKLGISQKKLAKQCEVSKSTIRKLEQNGKLPNIKTLLNIMHHLDLRLIIDPTTSFNSWDQFQMDIKLKSGWAAYCITEIEYLVPLGLTIRHQREDLGISQKELAKLCGISKSTIKKIEEDDIYPSVRR
ncbi:MAG: transcriptional regulator, partial [Allobaculum sp.]|nr:transcriptional regulator [Allobaculum sp.]